MMFGAVSAWFSPADPDAEPVERDNVTRSEALEFVDMFWAEIEDARTSSAPFESEINLCFSRDLDSNNIEFPVFDPNDVTGIHGYAEKWKFLGFIPMTSSYGLVLECRSRADVAALVEAYLTISDRDRFVERMQQLGAEKSLDRDG